MALFGGSSSKTRNITNTQNAGFSEVEGEATAIQGDGNSVRLTDHKTVGRAFDLAEQSIGSVEVAADRALSQSSDAISGAQSATAKAVKAVSESAKSETQQLVTQLGTFVIIGLIVQAVVRKVV